MLAAESTERPFDGVLLLTALLLLGLGIVMIASASAGIAERDFGTPFAYFWRQLGYAIFALLLGALLARLLPLDFWLRHGPLLLAFGTLLLLLLPLIGHSVNGSTRWLRIAGINLQVSELVKLALVIYLSGYLLRRGEAVTNTWRGYFLPLGIVSILALLCLLQPDFGAATVLLATTFGMLFLAGVRFWIFVTPLLLAVVAMGLLAVSESYRLKRLTAFLDPWADPFDTGFQLTQALIAFGRGDWFGVGLGASVQKLFYLPEAHTDFVFAVLGEELGLIGVVTVILLYVLLISRVLAIGWRAQQAQQLFGSYLAYGVGLWLGMQVLINIGVNMGVLPTKGLTLPLMSYGGSSMLANCIALALVLRVDHELRIGSERSEQGRRRR